MTCRIDDESLPNSGAYLICAKTPLYQDLFNPLNVVALQLNEAVLYSPTTGELGFQIGTQLLEIDLVRIDALNDCYLFTVPTLLNLDCYSLLFLGNLFTDTKLPGETADSAHLRTHLVAVTSNRYRHN